jgi:hypothetical protein
MAKAFFGLGATTGTYADRVALTSHTAGMLFYQTDTDEIVKYGTDVDGTQRWMMADHDYGRNLVVNGGFDVWQRATSATTSTADFYGPADRWQTVRLSSDTQRTFSRQPVTSSDTPVSGFTYFMRCQRDASNAAVNSILMATSFETTSVRRTQNKYVTLSFFARAGANYSAASGFLRAYITTGTGTDGRLITGNFTSPTVLVDSNNVLTTSWKRFTVTTSAPVGSTVTQMGITFQFNPVGTAGAADYYDVTGVQLEAVSAPSDFEYREFGDELRRCQRYYFRSSTAGLLYAGQGLTRGGSGFALIGSVPLPTLMRVSPTVGGTGIDVEIPAGTVHAMTQSFTSLTTLNNAGFYFAKTSGTFSASEPCLLRINNGYLEASAEL